jgi:type IV pilus assembly protein PilB
MEQSREHQHLGELPIKAEAVAKRELKEALEEQRVSGLHLGEIPLEEKHITEMELAQALSAQLGLPLVSLSRLRPTSEALNLLPEAAAKRLEVVPLSVMDNRIIVATAKPLDILALDEVRMLAGMEAEVNIATASDIRRALESVYSVQGRIEEAMVEVAQTQVRDSEREEEASATDAPVIRLVNNIIEQAVREEASDIHIEPFEQSTKVRFRVDGALFDSADFSKNLHPAVVSRIKIMANMDIAEKRRPQDGRILIKTDERRVDLRVSTLPTINGEKAAIRVLDPAAAKVGLELLGLEDDEKRLIDDIVAVPYGLALVTGPTGSGKSTTLYSILEIVSKPDVNVVTVEDPVEYTIPGVNQVQINEKAGVTFGDTLRAILRQDPDGHLVLSTLHTNDAPSSLIRLVDMGIQPFLVASSVVAVIAQRLVRKLCEACKEPYNLSPELSKGLGLPDGPVVYRPVGCDFCRGTGYKGRTGIFEIMVMNDELRSLFLAAAPLNELRDAAEREGMRSLKDAAVRKVIKGVTSLEEALEVAMQ